jgi:hypothetical protein
MSQNTNYTYTFSLNPPDGISNVKSAIITFEVYISPTVTFFGYIDGQPCSTGNYSISTTYASSGLGKINFDCTNRITGSGNYTFTLRPTQANTGASTGWIDLVYQNNPLYCGNVTGGNISFVENALSTFSNLRYAGGTEYLSGTEGQIAYQYITTNKGDPEPVNDAICNTTIWYPNNSIFISNKSMPYLTGSVGIYSTNFTVPSVQGVYKTQAVCRSAPKWSYGASTFHVEDSLFNAQQTTYSFLQVMNTTMVTNQNYIISLVQNVSTQISNSWQEFWDTASARILS